MFLTQEKALKKVVQERQRGDRKRALQKAKEALERWPDDLDIAVEAIQLAFDVDDLKEAVSLMKSTVRRHPKTKQQFISMAREALHSSFHPLLASFVIEFLIRNRDFDDARNIMKAGPASYLEELITRSETRSKGFEDRGQKKTSSYFENEMLLGLLYLEAKRWQDIAEPLGRAMKAKPDEAQLIGSVLLEVERERPNDANIQFYLGIASILLAHADKAEARFFRSIALENPPAEDMLKILEAEEARSRSWLMLKGEALIAAGRPTDGASCIRDFLDAKDGGWNERDRPGDISQLFPERIDRSRFALERLENIPPERMDDLDLTLLYCEIASGMEKAKDAVDALKKYFGNHRESAAKIAEWIAGNEPVSDSAPGQELLARLYLHTGRGEEAARAAGVAAEMDRSRVLSILEMINIALEAGFEERTPLLSIQAELYARSGNEEKASRLIKEMESEQALEKDELLRLSGEVLKHCGVSLGGVVSTIEMSMRNSRVADALPYTLEFYRSNTDARALLAEGIEGIGQQDEAAWPAIAELCDLFAAEEEPDSSIRFLRAKAHIMSGDIERAVFEFDQLMMVKDSLRPQVEELYTDAVRSHPDNTTLHLALYQMFFEDERFASAARHIGLAMETDPGQIRDLVPRFERLVERDPGNRVLWEEMLGSAMRIRHFELARELLRKAVESLPEDEASALHIHGARISIEEGDAESALRCVSVALTSHSVDLGSVKARLEEIISREPSNPEARFLAGETLIRIGAEDKAVAEFEKCITISSEYLERVGQRLERLLPVSSNPWLISRILGEINWAGSRRDEAMRCLDSALKGPKDSLLGLSETLKRLRKDSPDDAELTLIYARTFIFTGRYSDAASLLESLLDANPGSSGRVSSILEELIGRDPQNLQANRLLAQMLSSRGDREGLMEALLRIASIDGAAPEELIEALEPFLEAAGEDPRLLVKFGKLTAGSGDHKRSLDLLEKTLSISGSSSSEVLETVERIDWPAKLLPRSLLLEADCLLEWGDTGAAFSRLEKIDAGSRQIRSKMIKRLERIIESGGGKEHYEFASQFLAGAGDTKGAESILRKGIAALGGDDAGDLMITLGGIFEAAGMAEKSAECFCEVLGSGTDRAGVLARIEKSWVSWKEREIRSGLERIEAGETDPAETERLVRAAIGAGDLESAGKMIDAGNIDPLRRKALLARLRLAADRPLSALAIARSAPREAPDEDSLIELLYMEGAASEILGDHGRAAAAFARILGIRSGYLDAGERASRAYAAYLASQCEEEAGLLVATGDLDADRGKERR